MEDRQTNFSAIEVNEVQQQENEKWLNDNARDVINSIKDNLSKLDIEKGLSEKYIALVEQMEILDKSITSYGNNKLSLDDRDKLLNDYQNVANKIDDLKTEGAETDNEKVLFSHVETLSKFVSSDIRTMIKMDKPQTISEISQNGRKRVIDITNQNITHLGANQSDRQVISDGNEKKVFTKNEDFDKMKIIKDNIDKYVNKYPNYEKIFKKFSNLDCYSDCPRVGDLNDECEGLVNGNSFDTYVNVYHLSEKNAIEIDDLTRKDETAQRVMFDFLDSIHKIGTQIGFNEVIQTGKDEPIAERNSAMSVVAELLGIGNSICHSEPVIIKDGDKLVEGNLMNFSNGTDICDLKNDDPIATFSRDEVIVTKEAKKQIADVQVLDYICGNLDRHCGNLFMKYDTSDPLNPKLVGVEGIDNDASFYSYKGINKVAGYNRMIGLGNLQLIDKQTADKIKMISPAMLKMSLQGMKISEQAIENTIERFKTLQIVLEMKSTEVEKDNQIVYSKNKIVSLAAKHLNINVVKDGAAWDNVNILRLCKETRGNGNLFKQTYSVTGGDVNLSYSDKAKENIFNSKLDLASERMTSQKNIKTKLNILDKASKAFRSSNQYRAVQKELKKLQKLEKKIKFNDVKSYDNYNKALNDLKTKAQEYLTKKENEKANGANFSEYTKNRIEQVTKISEMVDERVQAYNAKITKFEEKNNYLEERNKKINNVSNEKQARIEAREKAEIEEAQRINAEALQKEQEELQAKINAQIKGVDKTVVKKSEPEVNTLEKNKEKENEKINN